MRPHTGDFDLIAMTDEIHTHTHRRTYRRRVFYDPKMVCVPCFARARGALTDVADLKALRKQGVPFADKMLRLRGVYPRKAA